MQHHLLLAAGLLAMAVAGCIPREVRVAGRVDLDGVPMDQGVIAFVAADGKVPPVTAKVRDGWYETRVLPGWKRVQISAPRVVAVQKLADDPDAPTAEVTEERVPDRYNTRTELEAEVPAGGATLDFSVDGR